MNIRTGIEFWHINKKESIKNRHDLMSKIHLIEANIS